jgi:hypothetical protein
MVPGTLSGEDYRFPRDWRPSFNDVGAGRSATAFRNITNFTTTDKDLTVNVLLWCLRQKHSEGNKM